MEIHRINRKSGNKNNDSDSAWESLVDKETLEWRYKDETTWEWFTMGEAIAEGFSPDEKKRKGIYLIYDRETCLYVGQGKVFERFGDHRSEEEFESYDYDKLRVTWAWLANKNRRLRAERYLVQELKPKIPAILFVNKPNGT